MRVLLAPPIACSGTDANIVLDPMLSTPFNKGQVAENRKTVNKGGNFGICAETLFLEITLLDFVDLSFRLSS